MSIDIVGVPGGEAPAPRKANWLLIAGVVSGLLVCALVVCVGTAFVFGFMGPTAEEWSVSALCRVEYQNLSAAQCSSWAHDVYTNHQAEYRRCETDSQSASNKADDRALFKCLDKVGLGPPAK